MRKVQIRCVLYLPDGRGCWWLMRWLNGSVFYALTWHECWAEAGRRLRRRDG